MFEDYVEPLLAFVRANQGWAPVIVGVLAFAESLAVLSLFVPAWGVLVGVGALAATGALPFAPLWIAASVGAILGDWVSYAVGWHFKDRVHHWWPFSKNPAMLEKAEAFFRKWGAPGVFIGRFSGPLRATVPLAAGIFEMPQAKFQFANVTSGIVWAGVLLYSGQTSVEALKAIRGAMGGG